MAAKDLVKTPRKRKLLCYIALGPTQVGYPFWRADQEWGYHSLPGNLKQSITQDVFLELMLQLLLDGLIQQKHNNAMTNDIGEAITCWRATAKGRRATEALIGDDIGNIHNVNHSQNSFC